MFTVVIAACLALSLAPKSAADSATDLRAAVDASRTGCPALQADPKLDEVAQRANDETNTYIGHTAQHIPFEDPMPVLRDMGYNAGKAKLLVGYGNIESKAIRGAVLQGWEAIPDCTYTRYGNSVVGNTSGGYVLAAVVLASD